MAAKLKAKSIRRKQLAAATVTKIPGWGQQRHEALERLSVPELKRLLRAVGLGIPKDKTDMVLRLSFCEAISIGVTTHAVAFDRKPDKK